MKKKILFCTLLVLGGGFSSLLQAKQTDDKTTGSSDVERNQPDDNKGNPAAQELILPFTIEISDGEVPELAADAAFEKYVESKLVKEALVTQDPVKLTDVGIQLLVGEAALRRSHSLVSAKTVFKYAANKAAILGDRATLDRIGKVVNEANLQELSDVVSAMEKLAGTSRSVTYEFPEIETKNEFEEEYLGIVKRLLKEAVLNSDKRHADSAVEFLRAVPVFQDSDTEKLVSIASIVSSKLPDSLPDKDEDIAKALAKLSGPSRGSVSQGPRYTGKRGSAYKITDQNIHFAVEVVTDLPFGPSRKPYSGTTVKSTSIFRNDTTFYTGGRAEVWGNDRQALTSRAWKTAKGAIRDRKPTHIWDDKWYYMTLPAGWNRGSTQKHLLMTATSLTKGGEVDSMAYAMIINTPSDWIVVSKTKTYFVRSDKQVKLTSSFNGHRVDLDIKNPPNRNGWTSNDIWYSFGY
jgi:hypothetical protein